MKTENLHKKRTKVGTVVSDGMTKTVAVLVERRVLEPTFKKYVAKRKKFLAHDEKEECNVGDTVRIQETRPLSKRKNWKVIEVLKRGFLEKVPV